MISTVNFIDLDGVVVCDDVRREDNGKELLIGVYSGGILVPKFPARLVLSLWLFGHARTTGEFDFDVRVLGPDSSPILEGSARAQIVTVEDASGLAIRSMPLEISKEGPLTFQWRREGGEWEMLKEKMVRLRPDLDSHTRDRP